MPSTPKRTAVKAISYRCISLTVKFSVFFLVTGSAEMGGVLAVVDACVATLLYYTHERMWSTKVKNWGKIRGVNAR